MMRLAQVSTAKVSFLQSLPWRGSNLRYSSGVTQLYPELAEQLDSRKIEKKTFQLLVDSQYSLTRPDHLKEVLDYHKIELRKAFSLGDLPEIALIVPQSFKFNDQQNEAMTEKNTIVQPQPTTTDKPASKKKKSLKQSRKNQIVYKAQREHIITSLRSYVDVSVQVGQYECALQAVNYYRWNLKKLHQRLGSGPPEPFPVDIYNALLSGCAVTGDFKLAMDVKQLMIWDNVSINASSYAYLLATAKGKADIWGLIKAMSAVRISLEDLFLHTALTEQQLEKLLSNIRSCDNSHDFQIPPVSFPSNKDCKLVAGLKEARVPFKTTKRTFDMEFLRKKAAEQKNRELAGTVSIKSIAASLKPTERVLFLRQQIVKLENEWKKELRKLFRVHLQNVTNQALHLHEMSVYPYLLALDEPMFVDLMIQEMRAHALASESFSMSFTHLASQLGQRVETIYHIQSKVKNGFLKTLDQVYDDYLKSYDTEHTTPSRERWQSLITQNSHLAPCLENHRICNWPKSTSISVGRFLYGILRQLKVDVHILQPNCDKMEMMNALYSVYRTHADRTKEELKAHKILSTLYNKAEIEDLQFDTTLIPMLCPPKPWCHSKSSPFLVSESPLVRVLQEFNKQQMDLIDQAPVDTMYPSLDALNVLSRTPWIINKPLLEVLTHVFLTEGDKRLDVPKNPNKMVQPDRTSAKAISKAAARYESFLFKREKAETYSLWCDMLYKLSIAHHFKNDVFFFPHNMDFRGRVYPCPPHFNHLGGDVIRGLLLFAASKPLGPNGLDWLKLHLINLTGFKKREPVSERKKFADQIIEEIFDSADNPVDGRKWWQTAENPWQTLAACKELTNAMRSPNPENYLCGLPIHQDGSCNGLQHYAALGRDLEGAIQVNLSPMDAPQDVYSGVADIVESHREGDAANGKEIAKTLEGHIERKVIKQTVMTVVYGVTRYGAHLQILRRLQDLENFPQKQANAGAHYLTEKTFQSLKTMFKATREIQDWFTKCARAICVASGRPIMWTTPLGLPVVQPYFNTTTQKSLVQNDATSRSMLIPNTDPHLLKQKNGFPPNFIHSLDSSHMMLTAAYSEAAGITFVSVHDCFWTHISTVEVMNKICREQFVALHGEPILENLAKEFQRQYCATSGQKFETVASNVAWDELQKLIDNVPSKGLFDLEKVLQSTYFFS